ncbi:hypothetical protein ACROYT_G033098 [Oculina patagonica]
MEAFVVRSFSSLLIIVLMASSAVTEKLSVESDNALNNGQTPSPKNSTKEDYNPDVTRIRRVGPLLPENISLFPDQQCYKQFFVNELPPVGLRNANLQNMRYICQPGNQQTYYATMFDEGRGIAVYSAYTLTQEKVKFVKGRPKDKWIQTPGIKNQGNDEIYKGSGFDKGHLFASKTASFELESSISTFTYTNAVPQHPGFNRGPWKAFEDKIRRFGVQCTGAPLNGVLYLITGVSFVKIQANREPIKLLVTIAIPNSMWTAGMCVSQDGNAHSFAVIGNNVQVKEETLTQQVTVAQLEAFLKIDVGYHGLKRSQVQPVNLFPGIAKSVNVQLV